MELSSMTARRYELASRLSTLPRRIVAIRDADYLAELVFCELCGQRCFGLKKAAYFLDNPDFDCCKGIVGINAHEFSVSEDELWDQPVPTSERIRRSPFYQKVRAIQHASVTKNNREYVLNELAKALEIQQPFFCVCHARNDNHGILISELPVDEEVNEYLEHGMSILGLCPLI